MLKYLHIKHFAIIDEVALDFHAGFTVLTGETGAGKSIVIDALHILLGERAENSLIKHDQDRCEITAIFDVTKHPHAQDWLTEQMMAEEANHQCLIRRVIFRDAPSRSTINGRPATLSAVRQLCESLIHIHGQNQHQLLLKAEYQTALLDEYAKHSGLIEQVSEAYKAWQKTHHQLIQIETHDKTHQREFLAFQLKELQDLDLKAGQIAAWEAEHQRLSHADQWLNTLAHSADWLSEREQTSVLYGLNKAICLLQTLPEQHNALALLQQASLQIEEATTEVRHALNHLEADPPRLQWLEQQLARVHDLARKHKTSPEALLDLQQALQSEYEAIDQRAEHIDRLQKELEQHAVHYAICAQKLTQSRKKAARTFGEAISTQIKMLGMANGELQIQLAPRPADRLYADGNEQVVFMINLNPGQPFSALTKVASGGELSRIALAIQVANVQTHTLPTLIFDEVDVGIGGGVAEILGRQLKKLSHRAQIICVTHLPQVAALGDQHLCVSKKAHAQQTITQIDRLSAEQRVHEIARMLGGVNITEKTVAHAKELVES